MYPLVKHYSDIPFVQKDLGFLSDATPNSLNTTKQSLLKQVSESTEIERNRLYYFLGATCARLAEKTDLKTNEAYTNEAQLFFEEAKTYWTQSAALQDMSACLMLGLGYSTVKYFALSKDSDNQALTYFNKVLQFSTDDDMCQERVTALLNLAKHTMKRDDTWHTRALAVDYCLNILQYLSPEETHEYEEALSLLCDLCMGYETDVITGYGEAILDFMSSLLSCKNNVTQRWHMPTQSVVIWQKQGTQLIQEPQFFTLGNRLLEIIANCTRPDCITIKKEAKTALYIHNGDTYVTHILPFALTMIKSTDFSESDHSLVWQLIQKLMHVQYFVSIAKILNDFSSKNVAAAYLMGRIYEILQGSLPEAGADDGWAGDLDLNTLLTRIKKFPADMIIDEVASVDCLNKASECFFIGVEKDYGPAQKAFARITQSLDT